LEFCTKKNLAIRSAASIKHKNFPVVIFY
jgi:hypothetical protein